MLPVGGEATDNFQIDRASEAIRAGGLVGAGSARA
jgi:hypothetical protein